MTTDLKKLISSPEDGFGDFKLTIAKTINILLVGRSGTGKTTIFNSLLNPQKGVESTSGYSDTKDPSCNS